MKRGSLQSLQHRLLTHLSGVRWSCSRLLWHVWELQYRHLPHQESGLSDEEFHHLTSGHCPMKMKEEDPHHSWLNLKCFAYSFRKNWIYLHKHLFDVLKYTQLVSFQIQSSMWYKHSQNNNHMSITDKLNPVQLNLVCNTIQVTTTFKQRAVWTPTTFLGVTKGLWPTSTSTIKLYQSGLLCYFDSPIRLHYCTFTLNGIYMTWHHRT